MTWTRLALPVVCLLLFHLFASAPLRADSSWEASMTRFRAVLDAAPHRIMQLWHEGGAVAGLRLAALPLPLRGGSFRRLEARCYAVEGEPDEEDWQALRRLHPDCLLLLFHRRSGGANELAVAVPGTELLLHEELLVAMLRAYGRASGRPGLGDMGESASGLRFMAVDGTGFEEMVFVVESHFRRLFGFCEVNGTTDHETVTADPAEGFAYALGGAHATEWPRRWPLEPRTLRPVLDPDRALVALADGVTREAELMVDDFGDGFRFVLSLPLARYLQILFDRSDLEGFRLSTVLEGLEDAVDEALSTPIVFAGVSYAGLDRAVGLAVDRGVAASITRSIPGSAFARTLPFLLANFVTHQLFLHDYSDILESDAPPAEKLVMFLRRVTDLSVWTRDRLVPFAGQIIGMFAVQAGVAALASASASAASFVATPLGGFLVGTLTFLVGSICADLGHRLCESYDGGRVAHRLELVRHVETVAEGAGDDETLRRCMAEFLLDPRGGGELPALDEAWEKHLRNLDERRMATCADVTMRIRQLRDRLRRDLDPLELHPSALMGILRVRPVGTEWASRSPWAMAARALRLRLARRYAEVLDGDGETSFDDFLAREDPSWWAGRFSDDFRNALETEERSLDDPTNEGLCHGLHRSWEEHVALSRNESRSREDLLETELTDRVRSFLLGDPGLSGAEREAWFRERIAHGFAVLAGREEYRPPALGPTGQGMIPRLFEEWTFNRGLVARRSFGEAGEEIYANRRARNARLERDGLRPLLRLVAGTRVEPSAELETLLVGAR